MNRGIRNFVLVVICLLASGIVMTRDAKGQDSSGVACLGRYWYSYTTDVEVRGDLAYLADSDAGLRIVNVSNPAEPRELAHLEMYGSANELELNGNYCYLADDWSGLRIIDISDPNSPILTSTFKTEGSAQNVSISGHYAYIAEWNTENRGGLRIVDINDPENPVGTGFLGVGNSFNLDVGGNYAYLGEGERFHVINVQSPSSPSLVGTCAVAAPTGIEVSGEYAYISNLSNGLIVIDIRRPEAPRVVGHWESRNWTMGVAVSDTLAYLACYDNGLFVLNIRNPISPVELGSCDLPDDSYAVNVSGSTAYIANSYNGLRIVDISNPIQPQNIGSFTNPGYPLAFSLYENLAYLLGKFGIEIFDVSDPHSPELLGCSGPPLNGRTVAVKDGYAFAGADFGGLCVFDVENPFSPRLLATLDTVNNITDIVINGDYAYVACTYEDCPTGVNVVDISNPVSPRFVVNWDDSTFGIYGIDFKDNLIFLTGFRDNEPGFFIINVEDPTSPHKVSFTQILGDRSLANDIVVVGDLAYLVGTDLYVFDVSNPESPHELGRFALGGMSLAIEGDYAFIAADQSGLRVININDPTNMHEVGFYDGQGQVWGVATRGSLAYIVNPYQEFGIYDCSAAMAAIEREDNEVPNEFALFTSYPNPFNAMTELRYSLPKTARVSLSVYDVEGREVKKLLDFSQHPGIYRLNFDATGLSAGAYIARMTAGEFSASQKLLLLK